MKLTTWLALAVLAASPVFILRGLEATQDPKISAAFSDLDLLRRSVALFAQRHGHLPTQAAGLAALAAGDDSEISQLPNDPWAHPYVYRLTASDPGFVVYSSGHDGIDDQGAGDDITSPDKSYRCMNYDDDCPRSWRWWQSHAPFVAFLVSFAWLAIQGARRLAARWRRGRVRPAGSPTPAAPAR